MPELPPPDECANCGAKIPRGAKACPECGADERTGWREQSVYDGLDLPEAAFDGEESPSKSRRPGSASRILGVIGVVLLIAAVIYAFVLR